MMRNIAFASENVDLFCRIENLHTFMGCVIDPYILKDEKISPEVTRKSKQLTSGQTH